MGECVAEREVGWSKRTYVGDDQVSEGGREQQQMEWRKKLKK
jgi:hypothetical protein